MYKPMLSRELIRLKKIIKTELMIVNLTSDGETFLDINKAIIHESELEQFRKNNRRWEQMKTDIANIVLEVLKKNRWGIYFKSEPMQKLPVIDSSSTLFKVNEVSEDELIESIKTQMEENTSERNNEWENHQAENKSQTDNESLSGTERTLKDTEK